jgi:predicted lipoprotein with Yx(FWY)xxD motif
LKRSTRAVLALAVVMAAIGAATATAATRGTTIKLTKTNRGKILTTARGFTLYMFSCDKRNRDVCVKIQDCTTVWPLVTSKSKPVAGPGVKSRLLGTIKLANGSRQVTYNGWPLYTYIGDRFPRSTQFVGLKQSGGFWWALNAAGKIVK